MQFTADSVITLARTLANDNHVDNEQWIDPAIWLSFFNWEYVDLYKRLVRMGLVIPAATDTSFTGYTVTIPTVSDPAGSGVLAVVGAAENLVSSFRPLRPAQSDLGREPYWSGTSSGGKSVSWSVYGSGDSLTVELNPRDASGNYVVRWIPAPIPLGSAGQSVDMPLGCDRRLAYSMVRHAQIKDSAASAAIDRQIQRADDELGLSALGKIAGDGPKVRRVRSRNQHHVSAGWMTNPAGWYFV